MLEAYKIHRTLKALEARLPNEAELVIKTIENEAGDMLSNEHVRIQLRVL